MTQNQSPIWTPPEPQPIPPYDWPTFVRERFKTQETPILTLLHAAVGIAGEWLELQSAMALEHRIEECGDLEFYIEAAYQHSGGEPERKSRVTINPIAQWSVQAGAPLDNIKKCWIYNKPFDAAVFRRHVLRVHENLEECYLRFLQVHRKDVLDGVVTKLRKRYPDGYSDAAAQARADKPAGE